MSRKANITVPQDWGASARNYANSVKENLDVLLGHRGHQIDRAVTFRDLLDSGVAKLADGVTITSFDGNAVSVDNNAADTQTFDTPPAPSTLTASGAFQNIILTWDLQTYTGHSHVEIWGHTSDVIASATLVASVSNYQKVYSDPVGGSFTRYYWIRAVNQDDLAGPFNSSTGTAATTQPDIGLLLTLLTNSITSSQLATSLATPIATIPTMTSNISSLDSFTGYTSSYSGSSLISRLGTAETSLSTAESDIDDAEAEIVSLLSSVSGLNTSVSNLSDSVADLTSGVSSVWVQNSAPVPGVSGIPDPIPDFSRWYDADNDNHPYYWDGDSWESLADARIADNATDITSLNTSMTNANTNITSNASSITALNSTTVTQGDSITSNSNDITVLNTEVLDAMQGNLWVASTAYALNTFIHYAARQYKVTTAGTTSTTAPTHTTGAAANGSATLTFIERGKLATSAALTSLTSTVTTNGTSIASNASDITTLNTGLTTANTNITANATAFSGLDTRVTSAEGTVTSHGHDLTGLSNTVHDALQGAAWAASTTYSSVDAYVHHQARQYQVTGTGTSGSTGPTHTTGSATNGNVTFAFIDRNKLATSVALSALSSTVTTNGNTTTSQGSSLDILNNDVYGTTSPDENTATLLATSSALSTLSSTVTTNGNNISSHSTDLNQLQNSVYGSTDPGGSPSLVLATSSALSGVQSDVTALDGTVTTHSADLTNLNNNIFDALSGTAWAATTAYALNAYVYHEFRQYKVTTAGTTGSTGPSHTTGAAANGSATLTYTDRTKLATSSALTALTNTVNAEAGYIDSLQLSVTTLEGSVYDESGELELATATAVELIENNVWGNGVTPGATNSKIDSLNTAVNDSETGLSVTSAAVGTLNTEVWGGATPGTAASRIDGLVSEVFNANGTARLATAAAFGELVTEVHGDGSAAASRIDGLDAEVFQGDGTSRLATAQALNVVQVEVFPDGTSAASRIDTLDAAVWTSGDPTQPLNFATASQMNTLTNEVFPDGLAEASKVEVISAQLWTDGDPDTALLLADATYTSNINAVVFPGGDQTATSKVDTLTNTVGEHTSSIQTQSETIDGLSSQYSVKIDNNGHVSGFGLSSTLVDGTPTSSFIVRADRFAIVTADTPAENTLSPVTNQTNEIIVPFAVQDSETTLNGVTVPAGVYMDTAFIKNGSITSAFIGNATIDDAKISDLSATKLTAGQIDASIITVTDINASLITVGLMQADRILLDGVSMDTELDGSIRRLTIKDLGVETLKIAGNAVTIPTAMFAAGSVVRSAPSTSYSAWTELAQLPWTSTGAQTLVHFYCDGEETTSRPGEFQIRLLLGPDENNLTEVTVFASRYMEGDNNNPSQTTPFGFSRILSLSAGGLTAGSRVIRVEVRGKQLGGGSSSGTFSNRSFMALETKK